MRKLILLKETKQKDGHYVDYKGHRILIKDFNGKFVGMIFASTKNPVTSTPWDSIELVVKELVELIDNQ